MFAIARDHGKLMPKKPPTKRQLSAIRRKAAHARWDVLSAEERSEIARNSIAKVDPALRRANAIKAITARWAKRTAYEKSS